MTQEEAYRAGQGRPSFLAFPLKSDEVMLGIIYADSKGHNSFGTGTQDPGAQKLAEVIRQQTVATNLIAVLAEAIRDIKTVTPSIKP